MHQYFFLQPLLLTPKKATPLHLVCSQSGAADVIRALLRWRASVDARARHESTPVQIAYLKGLGAAVFLLWGRTLGRPLFFVFLLCVCFLSIFILLIFLLLFWYVGFCSFFVLVFCCFFFARSERIY